MSTTVICDSCGNVVHTGRPHPTLTEAMASLAAAAKSLGYVVESVAFRLAGPDHESENR